MKKIGNAQALGYSPPNPYTQAAESSALRPQPPKFSVFRKTRKNLPSYIFSADAHVFTLGFLQSIPFFLIYHSIKQTVSAEI